MSERFTRVERLIGYEGLRTLGKSRVTVIGLGAVGSYAVEALTRAGIGNLFLIDHDVIQRSNINRQLYALESTLGLTKVEAARQRVLDINPECNVRIMQCFVHVETMDQVLEGPPDLVVDAIDSFSPKVRLLEAVAKKNIPVISSMGAALRTDPGKIKIGRISRTTGCPLARAVRKKLKKLKVSTDFPCIFSNESVANLPEGVIGGEDETQDILGRGRKRRPLGSLPTLTGIFGLAAANTAIKMLLGNPLDLKQ